MADTGYEFAVPAGFDALHAKAVLSVMKGRLLDKAVDIERVAIDDAGDADDR